MNIQYKIILTLILTASLISCSEQEPSEKKAVEKEHFLSEKQEALKKAKAVEQIIQDATKQRQHSVNN